MLRIDTGTLIIGEAFLAREDQLREIYMKMDLRMSGNGHPNFVFISQELGVGMTSLGLNLFNFQSKTVANVFHKVQENKEITDVVAEYMSSAQTVYCPIHHPSPEFQSLESMISHLMWVSALTQLVGFDDIEAELGWEKYAHIHYSVNCCFEILLRKTNCKSLYFYFDELQMIEEFPNHLFVSPGSDWTGDNTKIPLEV